MDLASQNRPQLGTEVPISDIPAALRRLWEADEVRTRASLMNLVIYSEEAEQLVPNSQMMAELTADHACRVLLLALDRQHPEPSVRCWVTAHCHLSGGKKSVCCEQLAFLLLGRAQGRLRNLIFSHLASDLPLLFWWQGELTERFEPWLYRLIDRLIFDSSQWSDPLAGYQRIEAARADVKERLVVQDLAWARSFHFRVAVASLFDDLIQVQGGPEVTSLRVGVAEGQEVTGLLFIAWFATQMGWCWGNSGARWSEKEGLDLVWVNPNGELVKVRLERGEGAALSRVDIATAPGAAIGLEQAAGERFLHQTRRFQGKELELKSPASVDSPEVLLADQLARGGKNSLLRKVLPTFLELLTALP